jgi:hypothetical protein
MLYSISISNILFDSIVMRYRFQRTILHFRCLIKNPSGWKFYAAGIVREIKEIFAELFTTN